MDNITTQLFNDYNNEEEQPIKKNRNIMSSLLIEEVTLKYINRFIKSNSKGLIKEFLYSYAQDINEDSNKIRLVDSITTLKKSFNIYVMDNYYDNESLYNCYSMNSYVRYANNILNKQLKTKLLSIK